MARAYCDAMKCGDGLRCDAMTCNATGLTHNAEGIADDVRPWLQKFLDTPAALGEACEGLPPAMLARLAKTFLPEGVAADLAAVDRLATPWVVVMGHRPVNGPVLRALRGLPSGLAAK